MAARNAKKAKSQEQTLISVLNLWKRFGVLSIRLSALSLIATYSRRLAWWHEDSSSVEAEEKFIIHCAEFGKGVDEISQKLSAEWIAFEYVLVW